MGSTVRGQLALCLEQTAAPGRQLLLPATAASGSISLTTQPNANSAGTLMWLWVLVSGQTASGTVAITGKAANGTTVVTETTPTLPAATANVPTAEYCTVAAFNTVDSSGVVITGLTGGIITIYGMYAASKLIPADFNTVEKFDNFSPKDNRGILFKDIRIQQLIKHVSLDKFDTALYPETSLYWPYAVYGAPTSTTLIGSSGSTPDVLKTSTAVSGTPLSLTSQPIAPGQLLQLVVTGASGGGSIAITGTNQFGIAASETVACNAGNGTYYSQNVYSAVASSGVAITGLSSGSLAVNGVFGTTWVFTMPTDPIFTCGVGAFSGTDTSAYPFALWESGDFAMDVEKEITLTSKVISQDGVPLGNRSTNPLSTNRLPTLGQPTDFPVAGWSSSVYIDDMTGTYATTQYLDLLDVKISINTGAKVTWTAQAQQQYARFYRDPPDVKFDANIDFLNLLEYEKFRNLIKRRFAFKFQERNRFIGNSSSTPIYKTWLFDLPAKYEMFDRDRSKEKVTAKVSGTVEYSEGDGNAGTLTITNQQPPTYATL